MRSKSPVFFFLTPEDEEARQIVSSPSNAFFKHKAPNRTTGLRIGVDHVPKTPGQLLTFGTDPSACDILLPQGFPRTQCHFFIHPHTGELLLRDDTADRSTILTTRHGQDFELPNMELRQRVLLLEEATQYIRMQQTVRFRLIWGQSTAAIYAAKTNPRIMPERALETDQARIYENGKIVHRVIKAVGERHVAAIYLTLDLNTGDHLAVKVWDRKSEDVETDAKTYAKQEVELFSKLSHVRYGHL
jgi:hypothetical protein